MNCEEMAKYLSTSSGRGSAADGPQPFSRTRREGGRNTRTELAPPGKNAITQILLFRNIFEHLKVHFVHSEEPAIRFCVCWVTGTGTYRVGIVLSLKGQGHEIRIT